jgi:hypothetical protein
MTIRKTNGFAVVHGHPKKKGSKRDKPKGSIIAKHKTKKEAVKQHQAIMASKRRRGER